MIRAPFERRGSRPLTGLSPATRRFLVGCSLMGAAQAVPWTLLNLYLDRLGYSKADIGSVQSCDAWGKVLIAIPAAFLLAHRRTPPILVVASLLAGVAYACLPWMGNLHAIMACNLVAGLAWSVHYVAIAPFLYRHAPNEHRARVFGLAEAVHTAAAILGAWACGRAAMWLTPWLASEAQSLGWVISFAGVLAFAAVWPYAGIDEAPEETGGPVAARAPVFATARAHCGLLVRFALPQLLIASGAGLCIPFLGLYFKDRFGFSPGNIGNLNASSQILMTAGFLVTPFLLRKIGFVKSVVALELLSIPFFLLLAFTTSAPVAVLAFLMRGALMNSATPVLKNFSMHASPEGLREVQNGVTSLMNGLGWVVGPRIGGLLLDQSGDNYRALMCTTVGFYVAAAIASYALLARLERAHSTPIAEERNYAA